jgi:hypothetical protein
MKKRSLAGAVVGALVVGLLVMPSSSGAIKAGTSCKKAGLQTVDSGRKYTCVKQGKKFVWNKGVVVKVAPVAKPSPSATPTPTASPVASEAPTPKDQLDFKNPMIYGIESGMLTRRADSGIYFNSDSRKKSEFSDIRVKAYEALNQNSRNLEHPKINFIYRISPTFPEILIPYTKRELSEAAALWNPVFDKKIDVYVDLVTEKDRENIKSDNWLKYNLPGIFSRFDSKTERPFISGGGGYWNQDLGWVGRINLATASYLDLSYVNFEWPQVAKHEFFHVVQDYAFLKTGRERPQSEQAFEQFFPLHYREGGANAISYLTAFGNIGWSSDAIDWVVWKSWKYSRTWKDINSVEDSRSMIVATESRVPEQAFEQSYAIGALMYEWMLGTYGLDGFTKFLNTYATTTSYSESLRTAFNLSKDEFYDKVSVYVYENVMRVKK